MNNRAEKLLIILIVIIIVIVIAIIIAISKLNMDSSINNNSDSAINNNVENVTNNWVEALDNDENYEFKIQTLKSNDEYYALKQCINNYMYYVNDENSNNKYLDKWYINSGKESKITKDYIKEYTVYEPERIQYISKNNIYIYYVYGYVVISEGTSPNIECNLIVKLDYNNYKYSIIPEIIENIYLEEGIFEEITDEAYSDFTIRSITNVEIATRYFEEFAITTVNNLEKSYNLIEEEYKVKKFNNNIEIYKAYISKYFNYKEQIIPLIEKCKVLIYDTYTMYIATDSNQNTYIIKELSVNDFRIMLDTETVKVEEIYETDKGE